MILLWCADSEAQTHDGYAYCAQQAHAQIKPKEREGRAKAYYNYYSACLARYGLRPGYGTYHPSQQAIRQVDPDQSQLHLLLDDTDEQWEREEDNYEYMMQQQNYEDMRQEDDRWMDEQQRQAEEARQREEDDRAYMEQRERR